MKHESRKKVEEKRKKKGGGERGRIKAQLKMELKILGRGEIEQI